MAEIQPTERARAVNVQGSFGVSRRTKTLYYPEFRTAWSLHPTRLTWSHPKHQCRHAAFHRPHEKEFATQNLLTKRQNSSIWWSQRKSHEDTITSLMRSPLSWCNELGQFQERYAAHPMHTRRVLQADVRCEKKINFFPTKGNLYSFYHHQNRWEFRVWPVGFQTPVKKVSVEEPMRVHNSPRNPFVKHKHAVTNIKWKKRDRLVLVSRFLDVKLLAESSARAATYRVYQKLPVKTHRLKHYPKIIHIGIFAVARFHSVKM